MKTTINTVLRPAAIAPPPSMMPPADSTRPVRRGSFWPGESFSDFHPKSELTEALGDHRFILPGIIGRGSRSH